MVVVGTAGTAVGYQLGMLDMRCVNQKFCHGRVAFGRSIVAFGLKTAERGGAKIIKFSTHHQEGRRPLSYGRQRTRNDIVLSVMPNGWTLIPD